jgi:hypothetical protein
MSIPQEVGLGKVEEHICRMLKFLKKASVEKRRLDEVERGLFSMLLGLGFELLRSFVEQAGDGDEGEVVERDGRLLWRSSEKHAKPYRSIFGVLEVGRYVYAQGSKKKAEWTPLDARLGMPQGEQSYVLEEWTQRLCIKDAYGEAVRSLRDLLGVSTAVRTAEAMSRNMAQYAEGYRTSQPRPNPKKEEAILVVTADGKGVPMRRPLAERLRDHHQGRNCNEGSAKGAAAGDGDLHTGRKKKRLGRGEKRTRKQMAYVGAVYTIAPYVRSAEDILDEYRRKKRQVNRPRPQQKHVWAEMTEFRENEIVEGQPKLFTRLAQEVGRRDPKRRKLLVCLMDGQRSLWTLKESYLGRAVGILDIFHVLERLWGTAYCFHSEGSSEAEEFVDRYLRMLLEGKVGYVIGVLRRFVREHRLKGQKRKTVTANLTYFENNRQYMRYDEYLASGFPIGSGVVEGACRYVVKDRMERTGMRWEIEGAQAVLSLRSIYLNNEWGEFVNYRIKTEQDALYGSAV